MNDKHDSVEWIQNQWARSLTLAISAVGGGSVVVEIAGDAVLPPAEGIDWWEQELSITAGPAIRVGAPGSAWKAIANRCLEDLGVTSPSDSEALDTWYEIVAQSLALLAARLTEHREEEVVCLSGRRTQLLPAEVRQVCGVRLRLGDAPPMELYFHINHEVVEACLTPGFKVPPAHSRTLPEFEDETGGMFSMAHVDMQVSLSFGKVYLTLGEALTLTAGHIIPLNRAPEAPGELRVNRRTVARGPIVEAGGFYGITIEEFCGGTAAEKGRLVSAATQRQ